MRKREDTTPTVDISGYGYNAVRLSHSHDYLLSTVLKFLDEYSQNSANKKIFELGCGNGSVADVLTKIGWVVVGVDPSSSGIAQANRAFPTIRLEQGSTLDDLAGLYGQFPVVLSLEVIEHVYSPRQYAETVFKLTAPGGSAIISTPYHGYWKNLALAISGKLDAHFTALWEHGHIKFWSIRTLVELLRDAGFVNLRFFRVGRVPPLAKSVVVVAQRPLK